MYGAVLLVSTVVTGLFSYLKYRAYLKSIDNVVEKLGLPGLKAASTIGKPAVTQLPGVPSLKARKEAPKEPPMQTAA